MSTVECEESWFLTLHCSFVIYCNRAPLDQRPALQREPCECCPSLLSVILLPAVFGILPYDISLPISFQRLFIIAPVLKRPDVIE